MRTVQGTRAYHEEFAATFWRTWLYAEGGHLIGLLIGMINATHLGTYFAIAQCGIAVIILAAALIVSHMRGKAAAFQIEGGQINGR